MRVSEEQYVLENSVEHLANNLLKYGEFMPNLDKLKAIADKMPRAYYTYEDQDYERERLLQWDVEGSFATLSVR